MRRPTEDEIAQFKADTREHIANVTEYLKRMSTALMARCATHDRSKFEEPELSAYAVTIPQLKGLKYGTPEHKAVLAQMKPAIQHHHQANSHHPEHHRNGIAGMDLIDLLELTADWKAASLRGGGDFEESLKVSAKRFNLDPQLLSIIANTAKLFE